MTCALALPASESSVSLHEANARALLERLRGARRPPSGPLTTEETAAAPAREKTPVKDNEPTEREQTPRCTLTALLA
jgi:hypothetical protein